MPRRCVRCALLSNHVPDESTDETLMKHGSTCVKAERASVSGNILPWLGFQFPGWNDNPMNSRVVVTLQLPTRYWNQLS